MKMIIAAAIALMGLSASANTIAKYEKEGRVYTLTISGLSCAPVADEGMPCEMGTGGVPTWLADFNQWFVDQGLEVAAPGVCQNDEGTPCHIGAGSVPAWLSNLSNWFVQHGFTPSNDFSDEGTPRY